MGVIHTQKINGPAAWKASDFQNNSSWIRLLSKAEINELKAAVTGIKDRGLIFPHFTKTDFPLPIFSSKLAKYGYELETGYGFILLRGIPVDSYSDETDLDILYYGIGLHMGEPGHRALRLRGLRGAAGGGTGADAHRGVHSRASIAAGAFVCTPRTAAARPGGGGGGRYGA